MSDLKLMIILIEGQYPSNQRNTPYKMRHLLMEEFGVNVSESDILHEYGLVEDYELESRKMQYGYN